MRVVPERSTGATFFVLIGAFVSGPVLGLQLGAHLFADSEIARVLSVMVFPLSFFLGLAFWMGFGIFRVVLAALRNLLRGGPPAAARLETTQTLVPPGYGAFVVIPLVLTTLAGMIASVVSATSAWSAVPACAGFGGAYGLTLWWLAHHGYLPFPEPQ
jgi:hypothetical protein